MSFKTHLLEYRRQRSPFAKSPPSGHCGVLSYQQIIGSRQADRRDVRREIQRFVQLHQGQIVFVGEEIVFGMDHFLRHGPLDVGQLLLYAGKVVFAHSDSDLGREEAEKDHEEQRC